MSFPINFNNRLNNLNQSYLPLHGDELLDLIKRYNFNTLREPVVVNFTDLNSKRMVEVKGTLDDIEVNPPTYNVKPRGFNIVILTFKGDKLTKLGTQGEEDFQIKGSVILVRGNDVCTRVVLIDGTLKNCKKVPDASGIINSIGSLKTYEELQLRNVI